VQEWRIRESGLDVLAVQYMRRAGLKGVSWFTGSDERRRNRVQKETEKEDGRLEEEQNVARKSNKPHGQFVGICQMHVINCSAEPARLK
jgi:hypothetical protein